MTFALPGLGSLIVDAVQKRDIPLIQGTTLVFAVLRGARQPRHRRPLRADRSAHPLRQGRLMSAPGRSDAGRTRRSCRGRARRSSIVAVLIMAVVVICAIFGSSDRPGLALHPAAPGRRPAALGGVSRRHRPPRPRRALPRDPRRLDRAGRPDRDRRRRLRDRDAARPSFRLSRRLRRFGHHALGRFHVRASRTARRHRRRRRGRRRLLDGRARADHPLHRAGHAHRPERRPRAAAAPLYRRGAHARRLEDAHPLRAHPAERAADHPRLCRSSTSPSR